MQFTLQLGDDKLTYTAKQAQRFLNDCCDATDEYIYLVDGANVTREDAVSKAQSVIDSAYVRKLETHKRVRVCVGASKADSNFREVWVRR